MEIAARPDPLLAQSVIVTGTHFSTTTLVGALLATAPQFHLLHEPLNPEPTLSFDSLGPSRWYEYYDESRFEELHDGLARLLRRGPVLPSAVKRFASARSLREMGQAARYIHRRLPTLLYPRAAILKDPFLALSALTLQQKAGLKLVWCLRHPGAFAESFLRKTEGFDFRDFASQPLLMEKLGEDAEDIRRFAQESQPLVAQAALLWRVINGFGARHLLVDPRSTSVRQEDFLLDKQGTTQRLLAFVGAEEGPATSRFLATRFTSNAADQAGSYTKRDPQLAAMKWKARLAPDDIAQIKAMTAPLAQRLGFDEASWPH